MCAEVLTFRPFQTARDQARRAGVPTTQAVREVREAQRRGDPGNHIAGQYRAMAMRAAFVPGGAA